jgi:hypothetical protein
MMSYSWGKNIQFSYPPPFFYLDAVSLSEARPFIFMKIPHAADSTHPLKSAAPPTPLHFVAPHPVARCRYGERRPYA